MTQRLTDFYYEQLKAAIINNYCIQSLMSVSANLSADRGLSTTGFTVDDEGPVGHWRRDGHLCGILEGSCNELSYAF